jgi:hypothetical protein
MSIFHIYDAPLHSCEFSHRLFGGPARRLFGGSLRLEINKNTKGILLI